MVIFNLKTIANSLDNKLGSKGHFEQKFGLEYLVPNVTEEKVLEAGFTFTDYDFQHNVPMYRYENLEAFFSEGILHIYELTI